MTLLIDLILAGVALEAVALFALRRAFGQSMLPNLAAGAFLLLALRLALGGAWWGWICAALLGGLVAHLGDLRSRWAS